MIIKHYARFLVLFELIFVALLFSGCIPPFIDGAVEAEEYLEPTVSYLTYKIDANADSGFTTAAGAALSLSNLTDNDENNIDMQYYYSFTFKTQKDFTLKTVAFIVEVEDAVTLDLQIKYDISTFNQSIDFDTEKKKIITFSDLNLDITVSSEIEISLLNPLLANVKYRIDSLIFII